ncbi:MAG: D-glycero-beta-D-manno-heptose 1-phosphate adenylyltransferase [Candidatus Omnitrophica bacterium]|nr:D-glycero-beta-D-manno-heptose 1-phosphate adenylyltransferase [Candidatus Omnitrophota bacterium]
MTSFQKIVTLPSLRRRIPHLRSQGLTIAFTNGCFDILHLGHVRYLEAAKKKNRVLIVGLNSDASVRKIKGPTRPVNSQEARAGVLAALSCVDFVVIFKEHTPYKLIQTLEPDVLIKGADWKGKEVVGADVVKARGGRVELIKYVDGCSTTDIIKKIEGKS